MQNKKIIIFIFISMTFLASCSFLSEKISILSEPKKPKNLLFIKPIDKYDQCSLNDKFQLIAEDEMILKYIKYNYHNLFIGTKYSFFHKAIYLVLLEMARRPDVVTPNARIQLFFKYNNHNYYFDVSPKDNVLKNNFNLIYALNEMVKKFIPQSNLLNFASELDNITSLQTPVSMQFESFLKDNKNSLSKNSIFTESYFKGEEILTRYETFKKKMFKPRLSYFINSINLNKNAYTIESDLNTKLNTLNPESKVICNYNLSDPIIDMKNSINFENLKSHKIGFKDGNNYFLAITSSILNRPLLNISQDSLFESIPSKAPFPLCLINSPSKEMMISSLDGIAPGQHILHLLDYEIEQTDSFYNVKDLLNFSRHLFLKHPDRILYESKRGRKSQLDFFLAMKFPLYHVESLGNIVGHANFSNSKSSEESLFIDERDHSLLWCQK